MTLKQPTAAVMLEIPDCRMQAAVTLDRAFTFHLGWPRDTALLEFKTPEALRRFIRLAQDILDAPTPDNDSTSTKTHLVSSPE